jgi:hypothetical protein
MNSMGIEIARIVIMVVAVIALNMLMTIILK